MKYFPNCGAELESDDKNYCSNCGFNLRMKEDSNQNETNTDEKKKIDLKNKNGDSLNSPKSSDKGQQKSKKWILYIVLAIACLVSTLFKVRHGRWTE